MERITYRITLDAHKTGIQKTLQGFDANDKLSRRIIISLTSGGKPVEFESTDTVAVMYVTKPNLNGRCVEACTIENNTIIYDVSPIEGEGIAVMQVELIETSIDGAESVLMCPKFAVEVTDSDGIIDVPTATFTALENAIAQANGVYNERLLRIDIDEECTFRAYYADDTVYESDSFKEALGNYVGNAKDSEYNAHVSEVGAMASASLAKISESNAKASEENAKVSEANAKRYMENALNATPEGYGLMDIQETTNTTLENSKAGGYKLLSMSGNSVQNGTPTPDAPQSIHNVGDCVEMMQGYYGGSNGIYGHSTQQICTKNKIPCNSGDVIRILTEKAANINVIYYNENSFLLTSYSGSATKEMSYHVPENATHFCFNLFVESGIAVDTVGKISLTINGKYVVQIATNYGVEMMQGGWNATSGHLPNVATCVCNKTQVHCKTGDVVNIKCAKASSINLLLYNENTFVSTLPMSTSGVTIPSGVTNFKFNINSASDITPDTVGKITITINGVGEKVATVLLNEPLREDDVMSRTEVVRKRVKFVYDGSSDEMWQSSMSVVGRYLILTEKPVKVGWATSGLCSQATVGTETTNINMCYITASSQFAINTNFSTLDEWKAHLQANPLEIELELATPTIETLDTTSQIALNSLETFDGVTHINVDSRVQPSEIVTQYGTSRVGAITLENENLHRIISGAHYVRCKTVAYPVSNIVPHITQTVTENNVDAVGTINAFCTNDNIQLSVVTINNRTLKYSYVNTSETNQTGVILITFLY